MTLKLYNNQSENNTIGKNLSQIGSDITCTIKGDMSLYSPTIILDYSDISGANYAYIQEFDRYYFITDRPVITGGRMELNLKSDPLETFKDDILSLSAVVIKQQSKGNMYFNDGSFNVTAREFLQSITFPNGFNSEGDFILITCGG